MATFFEDSSTIPSTIPSSFLIISRRLLNRTRIVLINHSLKDPLEDSLKDSLADSFISRFSVGPSEGFFERFSGGLINLTIL